MPIFVARSALYLAIACAQVAQAHAAPPATAYEEAKAALGGQDSQAAAQAAKEAAGVAKKAAAHSIRIANGANAAIEHARDAVHSARVETQGLSSEQQASLKNAEARLETAGNTHQASAGKGELERMQQELQGLRQQVAACKQGQGNGDKSVDQMDTELRQLQEMLKKLEAQEAEAPASNHAAMKVEIKHLREAVGRLEKFGSTTATFPKTPAGATGGELRYRMAAKRAPARKVQLTPLASIDLGVNGQDNSTAAAVEDTTAVAPEAVGETASGGARANIDVDTEIPYGELEPFGREDTAQELTEASIRESDEMVDQIERAEVAEEKRAVFRALTRLRGAAITSFDGVARSQTGNIDEYAKVHQWRPTHPVRHLAEKESDVSAWAFPDDADF